MHRRRPTSGWVSVPAPGGRRGRLELAHALMQQRGADFVELPLAAPLRRPRRRRHGGRRRAARRREPLPGHDGLAGCAAPSAGLAPLEVSGVAPADVEASTLGYRLGPRLNAAGRLTTPRWPWSCWAPPTARRALPVALKLNELNAARQDIEATMASGALAMCPTRRRRRWC